MPTHRHLCKISSPVYGQYGAAATECYEAADGSFWIGNGEYSNPVSFCPGCGAEAPTLSAEATTDVP